MINKRFRVGIAGFGKQDSAQADIQILRPCTALARSLKIFTPLTLRFQDFQRTLRFSGHSEWPKMVFIGFSCLPPNIIAS
jgi:hypothetical protein